MSDPKEAINVEWCEEHEEWFVGQCAYCTEDAIGEANDDEISNLKSRVEELEKELAELKEK